MPVKIIRDHRGIALLVTLSVMTVLIVTTLAMNRKGRSAIFSAAATRDRITLLHMVSSGVHVAEAILVRDKKDSSFDSIQEDWANSEKIGEILNNIPFENGTLTLNISDELGKIQMNSLVHFPKGQTFNEAQRNLWERFLSLLISQDESLMDVEPATIIDSAKDWLDSGDDDAITGLNGAESDYYQDLVPPYTCKNGPFTHISELALVRGITPELLQSVGGISGLSKYITVFGMTEGQDNSFVYEGKININTADLPVLAVILPLGNEDLAQVIDDYRKEASESGYVHDLSDPKWYHRVPGMSEVNIDSNLITTSSDFFQIESTATLNEMKMKLKAVVKREQGKKTGKWKCRVLSWGVDED